MATTTPTPTPKAGAKQDPTKFVKEHPAIAAVLAGGGLGVFMLMRARSKAATATGNTTIMPAAMSDTSATDLQSQIDALATSIAGQPGNLPVAPGSTVPPTPPIPATGSGQVLYTPAGGGTPQLVPAGTVLPGGGTVSQGGVTLGPSDFDALGRYLASLPGGH